MKRKVESNASSFRNHTFFRSCQQWKILNSITTLLHWNFKLFFCFWTEQSRANSTDGILFLETFKQRQWCSQICILVTESSRSPGNRICIHISCPFEASLLNDPWPKLDFHFVREWLIALFVIKTGWVSLIKIFGKILICIAMQYSVIEVTAEWKAAAVTHRPQWTWIIKFQHSNSENPLSSKTFKIFLLSSIMNHYGWGKCAVQCGPD